MELNKKACIIDSSFRSFLARSVAVLNVGADPTILITLTCLRVRHNGSLSLLEGGLGGRLTRPLRHFELTSKISRDQFGGETELGLCTRCASRLLMIFVEHWCQD